MDEDLIYERRGSAALITLNRPDRLNALSGAMSEGVVVLARRAEQDPEVFSIIVTGAGRGFCAGADADYLVKVTGEGLTRGEPVEDHIPGLFAELTQVSKPVIAAINGPAAGAGFILAMMSDLRFMAEGAILTTVFSKRGLIAEHNSSWILPRIVGLSRALDLLWSSRRIDAAEAHRIGLADRVLPADQLIQAAIAYSDEMAATVAPRAVAIMKAQVYRDLSRDFGIAARDTDALVRQGVLHPDAKEGALSFVERRAPVFSAWTGGAP
jgi:enoyl-CoA hydratase/carnithine racemase